MDLNHHKLNPTNSSHKEQWPQTIAASLGRVKVTRKRPSYSKCRALETQTCSQKPSNTWKYLDLAPVQMHSSLNKMLSHQWGPLPRWTIPAITQLLGHPERVQIQGKPRHTSTSRSDFWIRPPAVTYSRICRITGQESQEVRRRSRSSETQRWVMWALPYSHHRSGTDSSPHQRS